MDARVILRGIQEPVRFPSYSDDPLSSPLWTNDGKQHITLPKTLFNGKQNPRTNGKNHKYMVSLHLRVEYTLRFSKYYSFACCSV